MNFQIHFDNIFPINKTKKQKKEPKPKKKTEQLQYTLFT